MGAKYLFTKAGNGTSTQDRYSAPFGISNNNSTESNCQYAIRTAGTFSRLSLNKASGVASNYAYILRVGGSSVNGTVAMTSTNGWYYDTTSSDSVSVGDLISFLNTDDGANGSWNHHLIMFEPDTWTTFHFGGRNRSAQDNTSTAYGTFDSIPADYLPTEADAQHKVRTPGTARDFTFRCSANAASADRTYTLRVNGADGNQSVTFGAGVTGAIRDTSNTDSLSDADLVCYSVQGLTATDDVTAQFCGYEFDPTTDGQGDFFGGHSHNGTAVRDAGWGTPHYITPLSVSVPGAIESETTEADQQIVVPFDCTASKLRLYVSANSYASTATITFRVDGSDTALTFTISAAATGWHEDATNEVTITDGDLVSVSIVGGTSGSLTIGAMDVTLTQGRIMSSLAGGGGLAGPGGIAGIHGGLAG